VVADRTATPVLFSARDSAAAAHADHAAWTHATWACMRSRRDFLLPSRGCRRRRSKSPKSLEQLRALEHGFRIRTVVTEHHSIGVDTPRILNVPGGSRP
jgi:LmbE family N-acetylglucosaminyl deacetylase